MLMLYEVWCMLWHQLGVTYALQLESIIQAIQAKNIRWLLKGHLGIYNKPKNWSFVSKSNDLSLQRYSNVGFVRDSVDRKWAVMCFYLMVVVFLGLVTSIHVLLEYHGRWVCSLYYGHCICYLDRVFIK